MIVAFICDGLWNLVTFVLFENLEKHLWRSVTFSAYNFTKNNTPPWVFYTFLKNVPNGTKSHKASDMNSVDPFLPSIALGKKYSRMDQVKFVEDSL